MCKLYKTVDYIIAIDRVRAVDVNCLYDGLMDSQLDEGKWPCRLTVCVIMLFWLTTFMYHCIRRKEPKAVN